MTCLPVIEAPQHQGEVLVIRVEAEYLAESQVKKVQKGKGCIKVEALSTGSLPSYLNKIM